MKQFSFNVYADPRPKGRPRFAPGGRAYTPKATRDYEEAVRLEALKEMITQKIGPPLTGPIFVQIDFCLAVPQSWSKARKSRAWKDEELPASRPDLDNLAKSVLDGLRGVCYKDDAQITCLLCNKRYRKCPKVFVMVQEVL